MPKKWKLYCNLRKRLFINFEVKSISEIIFQIIILQYYYNPFEVRRIFPNKNHFKPALDHSHSKVSSSDVRINFPNYFLNTEAKKKCFTVLKCLELPRSIRELVR